ncbi:MAG: hypothetical protein MK100_04045 [Phycisphaerales bacterium]|nr:hypothetical protein [Phycisphaerales bacterium]
MDIKICAEKSVSGLTHLIGFDRLGLTFYHGDVDGLVPGAVATLHRSQTGHAHKTYKASHQHDCDDSTDFLVKDAEIV